MTCDVDGDFGIAHCPDCTNNSSIEQTESHIVILLFLFRLGFLLGSLCSTARRSATRSTTGNCNCCTATCAVVYHSGTTTGDQQHLPSRPHTTPTASSKQPAANVINLASDLRTCAHVGDEIVHGLFLKQLGKETGPVWLDLHACCFDDGSDVVGLSFAVCDHIAAAAALTDKLNTTRVTTRCVTTTYADFQLAVCQDQGRVYARELTRRRHPEWY